MILDTNLKNRATGQYLNFDVNAIVKFDGKYWASGDGGFYLLEDIDTMKEAYFLTGTMDFGINNDKRLRYVYLSLESTDNLSLTINTEKVAAITFPVTIAGTGQQDVRVSITRNLYGRFWTFKVSGTCDFSIDEIRVLPIIRALKF